MVSLYVLYTHCICAHYIICVFIYIYMYNVIYILYILSIVLALELHGEGVSE